MAKNEQEHPERSLGPVSHAVWQELQEAAQRAGMQFQPWALKVLRSAAAGRKRPKPISKRLPPKV